LETSQSAAIDLRQKLGESTASLSRLASELDVSRRARSRMEAQMAGQETEIARLNSSLNSRSEDADRERKLLVADRDIRDLMGARNLHIIDVFDVDGRGKTRRPFGRVFYTEKTSLVFYAFDLGDKKMETQNASFQAWGYHEPKAASVQSLGIFYADDRSQNRWVLKFKDPGVLAEIDSVFVTVEPPGGSNQPKGQKLLYAYLNATANHP